MKILTTFALLSLFVTQASFAANKEITACNKKQLEWLKKTIAEKKADGFINSRLMKNADKEVVGFYSWNKEEDDMYTEICEYLGNEDVVVSSEWYYWNEGSTNPAKFKNGETYRISQDEGIADLKILKSSKSGNVKIEMSILGWEEGDAFVVRRSVLDLE